MIKKKIKLKWWVYVIGIANILNAMSSNYPVFVFLGMLSGEGIFIFLAKRYGWFKWSHKI